jgi:hypothetical protein
LQKFCEGTLVLDKAERLYRTVREIISCRSVPPPQSPGG